MDADLGQQPIADEGTHDPEDQVTNDPETRTSHDLAGQPACNDAHEQYYQQAFIRHMHCLTSVVQRTLILPITPGDVSLSHDPSIEPRFGRARFGSMSSGSQLGRGQTSRERLDRVRISTNLLGAPGTPMPRVGETAALKYAAGSPAGPALRSNRA
jgi:hypothetical protein